MCAATLHIATTTATMGSESLKRGRDDAIHNPRQSSTTSSKRRKQATQQSFELTKLYERLAAEADDERLAAAKELITKLSPDNNPSAEAVENALDRLVKGLCSQRKAARYGFFVTLTEILRQLYTSGDRKIIDLVRNVNGIIELVETRTQPRGNVSGQVRLPSLRLICTPLMYIRRKDETISLGECSDTKP